MEDTGPVSPAPGLSIATSVVWPSSLVASVFDYRLSNDPPQIYYTSVYYQDGGAGSIDPIQIKITEPSPTRAFPYEIGPLTIQWTPDAGQNWQQAVYTSESPLPAEGLTFTINGKATYDYNNPDIIITAGTGGDGFAPGPEPPGTEPLPPGGEESGPGLDSPPAGSVAGAKSLGDGESVSITGKVIVADRSQFAGSILYVEEPNRSAGIRVYYTGGDAALGETVDVSGTIYTNSDGERWIDAGSTGVTEATPAQEMPKSLGLNNRALGGGDWEYDSGTGAGQRGVEDGMGLNNIGLLVKTWGKVTSLGSDYYYINDGSDFSGGGYKVTYAGQSGSNPVAPVAVDCYVQVSGISSIENSGGIYARVLRPRDLEDVTIIRPADGDWPMFMHDPQHTGASKFYDTQTTENLTFVWSAPVHTATTGRGPWSDHPNIAGGFTEIFEHPYIDSSPVHARDCPVIVGAWASGSYTSSTGYVVAYDPVNHDNGEEIEVWCYPSSGTIGGVASTPAVAQLGAVKRVYFGSMDGKVYCLRVFAEGQDPAGSLVWSYQTTASGLENIYQQVEPARVLASPVVYKGRVYIGNESATVYCLNAADGSLLWSHTFDRDGDWPDRTGVSSVAIGPTAAGEMRAYVGCDNGYVYCLSLEDSPAERVLWQYNAEACVESSPTVYEGNVYVGVSWFEGRDLVALDAANGQLLWPPGFTLTEEVRATCAASDGFVYVGVDTGNQFFKLNFDTGIGASQFTTQPNE